MFPFISHCQDFYRNGLNIWGTRRVRSPVVHLVGSVLLIYLVVCAFLLSVFTFWVPCCDVRYDFPHKHDVRFVFTSSPVVCRCLITVISVGLRKLVSNTYCIVYFFVLFTLCCQFLWIVYFWVPLWYSLTFI